MENHRFRAEMARRDLLARRALKEAQLLEEISAAEIYFKMGIDPTGKKR